MATRIRYSAGAFVYMPGKRGNRTCGVLVRQMSGYLSGRLPDEDNGYTGGLRAQAPAPWPHRRGVVFVHRRKRIKILESSR